MIVLKFVIEKMSLIEELLRGNLKLAIYTVFQKKGSHQTFGNNFVKS